MTEASNLLVIMSDEHQARAMGCAGHPFVQTPNLDALAARGTVFTDAYTPSPICVPARAAFATGRYVHQTRLWDNAMPYAGQIHGWGHALQEQGVRVESIGKLHYRSQEDPAGFDVEHIPMMVKDGVGMVWASIRREDERMIGKGRVLGDYIGPGESTYTEYDRRVTERTVEWLRSRKTDDTPWCLYVGLVAPHFPLVCPAEFFDLYPPDSLPEPKLSPATGYIRHPWVEKQNAVSDTEAAFRDPQERRRAIAAYFGLCSWLDHNIGRILQALDEAGLGATTTVVYTSDHGDNIGARGLWGKSNLYQESVSVPMIAAGPGLAAGSCRTPVSLIDLSAGIAGHFGAAPVGVGRSVFDIADAPQDSERIVFSEYHAVGAVSGAFMLRKGRYKLHYYIDFPPELFDLETDPEEVSDLAASKPHAAILEDLTRELGMICDPTETNRQAFADQSALVEKIGGRHAALTLGSATATPPPGANLG